MSDVKKMGFKAKPHLQLYVLGWIRVSFHYPALSCTYLSYSDRLIVFGVCTWVMCISCLPGLFDLDVKSFGKSTTYTFMFYGKRIV